MRYLAGEKIELNLPFPKKCSKSQTSYQNQPKLQLENISITTNVLKKNTRQKYTFLMNVRSFCKQTHGENPDDKTSSLSTQDVYVLNTTTNMYPL